MMVGVLGVIGRFGRADVHAAIVAGGGFFIAGVAIQGPSFEELFEPQLRFGGQIAGVARDAEFVAAAIAVLMFEFGQQLGVIVVSPTGDLARAFAQGAGDLHLSGDRLADEVALVGELVQKLGKFFLHFKSDHSRLRRFSRHGNVPRPACR